MRRLQPVACGKDEARAYQQQDATDEQQDDICCQNAECSVKPF